MHSSQKKNLLLFLLIFPAPLSAGFLKRSLYSALPRIVLATQVAKYIALPLVDGISKYKDVQKNIDIYADPGATEYVTNLLRERNVIKPHETVPARWGNRYAIYCGTLIEIPRNPESSEIIEEQGMPEIAIPHEEGHRRNRDFEKGLIATTTLYAFFYGLGTFVARKAIFAPSLTIYESLGRATCASYIPSSIRGLLGNPLVFAYSRHRERMADQCAIRHAKNPEELEQNAAYLQKKHALYMIMDKNTPPTELKIKSITHTHPSDLERAQYFQRAADAMRARQKSTKSSNSQ